VDWNPTLPEVKQDPYPAYAALRARPGLARIEAIGGAFAAARFDDVRHVLDHPELFSSHAMGSTTVRGHERRMLIGADPPEHTRLRNLVNRSFTPRMVADLEPRIRQVTRDLIEAVAPGGRMDLIADVAVPLPVTIIAEILGVDPARKDDFKRWSDNVVDERSGHLSAEEIQEAERDNEGFILYFEEAIDKRRRRPAGDMISALVRAESEQQALDAYDVLAFVALLLIAGNETTTNLLGNAMIALLDNPEQLEMLRAGPSLIPNAVEEALRYDAPVQFLFRQATRDTEIAGTALPEGAVVLPLYGSANRDEHRYPDADRFDITRDAQGHIAFGHGIHFCLGAPLARLEARVALEALAGLRDLARPGEPVEYVDSIFLRGPKHLTLTFTPVSELETVTS
jgi:cytochrome P450